MNLKPNAHYILRPHCTRFHIIVKKTVSRSGVDSAALTWLDVQVVEIDFVGLCSPAACTF